MKKKKSEVKKEEKLYCVVSNGDLEGLYPFTDKEEALESAREMLLEDPSSDEVITIVEMEIKKVSSLSIKVVEID